VLLWFGQSTEEPGGVSESSDQSSTGALSRWVLIAWSFLSAIALLAHLVPAYIGWSRPEVRVERTVGELAEVVEQILERVPADSAILVDTWQSPLAPANQFVERELAYWVFPRPVHSAAAIRGSRRSLEEFVRSRGIRWGVRGMSLVPIDPSTIEADFAAGSLLGSDGYAGAVARSNALFGPLRRPGLTGWLLVVLAVAIGLAGGRGALRLLDVDGQMPWWSERWGWSWLVGFSITAISALLLFFSGHPLSPWLPLAPSLLLGLAGATVGLARRAPGDRKGGAVVLPSLSARVRLLVGSLVGVVVLIAVARGIHGFDQRMQWAYKARLMQTEAGPWGESVFQDPDHVHFHPRYPLLVPAAEAVWGGVGLPGERSGVGGFSESAAVLIFPLTWVALAGVVVGALGRLGSADPVRGGLLLLVLPVYSGLGSFQNNLAAFNGCPELVVGAALLAAVLAALAAHERGGGWWVLAGLCLVVAGLSKAEGPAAVAVVVGVALASAVAHRDYRLIRRIVAVGLVVGAVLMAHEIVFTRGVVGGILPDDYRELLGLRAAWEGVGRLPRVGLRILLEVSVAPWFGAIGLLLLFAIQNSRGAWACPAAGWPLAICAVMLAAYCVPFLVIPRYLHNLNWAAGRLVVQVVPLATWALIVILDRSHRTSSMDPLTGDGSGVGGE
jgi:hypothetical protein